MSNVKSRTAAQFVPNGQGIRTMDQWSEGAKSAGFDGERPGQAFARSYADEHGVAVILWEDGHVTIKSRDNDDLRID